MNTCRSCVFRHDPLAAYGRRGSAPRIGPDIDRRRPSERTEVEMSTERQAAPRRTSFAAGVLFLITFITSIPALRPLPAGPRRSRRLHRRRRRRQPDLPGGDAGADPDRRQHRDRRRAVPGPQAAERDAVARLRDRPDRRVRLHRGGDPLRPRDRLAGAGRPRRRLARRVPGRDQGLDVPARARRHRRDRQRPDPRLPDVPLRAGAAAHGDAGDHRGPAAARRGDRRAVRRRSSRAARCRASRRSPSSSGSCRSAST